MGDRGPIAFVTPRYGEEVVGGSEAVSREAAHGLAARGWEVEVLTTPARDHYTWAPGLPARASSHGDVLVRRFELVNEHGRYPGQPDPASSSSASPTAPPSTRARSRRG